MAYTRTFSGTLTAYRGTGNTINKRDDQSVMIAGTTGRSIDDDGNPATPNKFVVDYLYGVRAKFDLSSVSNGASVSSLSAKITRTKGESDMTYTVGMYQAVPSVNIDNAARTGYTEIYSYREALSFTGGSSNNDYSISRSINTSYFDNLKKYGWLLYGNGSQSRRAVIKSVDLVVTTNEDVFTLNYDANRGTGAPASQTGVSVSSCKFVISNAIPVRKNYKFLGWSLSKSGTATYKAGDEITVGSLSTTLYAVWELDVGMLTFDANTGTGAPSPITDTIGTSITIPDSVPVKAGWTFDAWNTKADGTGTSYKVGAKYTVAVIESTLYAIYKENIRTVTYNANGGEGAPSAQSAVWSKAIVISNTIPYLAGHLFRGWASSATATEPQYDIGDSYISTADVTLYAVWKQADYSVFRYDGSKWVSVSNVYRNNGNLWTEKVVPWVNDFFHRFKSTKL